MIKTKKNNSYAILIPAYNEENTIRTVVQHCLHYCRHIVVVDDGSIDNTVANIQDLPITILHNGINRGKDASLLRGFSYCQHHQLDAIITIDADTQHNPDDIPKFLAAREQYPHHVILGARHINQKSAPFIRWFANRAADFFISWAAGKRIPDTQSGFRLYPVDFIPTIVRNASQNGKFIFESKVLIDAVKSDYPPVSLLIVTNYPDNARASYFRPFIDTMHIVLMISQELLSRGFYPKGLWLALFKQAERFEGGES